MKTIISLLIALQMLVGAAAVAAPVAPLPLTHNPLSRSEVEVPAYDAEKGIVWTQTQTQNFSDVDPGVWVKQAFDAIDAFIRINPGTLELSRAFETRASLIDVVAEMAKNLLEDVSNLHGPREQLHRIMQLRLNNAFDQASPAQLELPVPPTALTQSFEYLAPEGTVQLSELRNALHYTYIASYGAQVTAADRLEVSYTTATAAPDSQAQRTSFTARDDLFARLAQFMVLYPQIKAEFNGPHAPVAYHAFNELIAPLPAAWRTWTADAAPTYEAWNTVAVTSEQTLRIDSDPLSSAQLPLPAFRVVRNAYLSPKQATRPEFIFISAEAKFAQPLQPTIILDSTIELAKPGAAKAPTKIAMSKLFNSLLGNTNPAQFSFQLTVNAHLRTGSGVEIVLPVTICTIPGDELNPNAIGDAIDQTVAQLAGPNPSGSLQMSLNVLAPGAQASPRVQLTKIMLPL